MAGRGAVLAAAPSLSSDIAADPSPSAEVLASVGILSVKSFGATGDGQTIDTPAINRAIDAAAASGGGTVYFPAGTYASYSIHLKSQVCLYLDQGATILAASTPAQGTANGGYDAAEPQGPWEPYQDYGHNHWHNSLLWGEGIHDISILGPGRIWGKGLSRGHSDDTDLPDTTKPGVGNKAIALKNCHNVILRDFSILMGGWFAILATGVDNLTIDNLKIDTNRDGIDIDCCRNVRVSNCAVNSPYDDGICPKSSFALGYPRHTENLTISNCFLTGSYEIGTMLDATWKRMPEQFSTCAPLAASSAAPNPTAASATSPFPTASSNIRAESPLRPSTARSAKTSPSPASPCAAPLPLRSFYASASVCAGQKMPPWGLSSASSSAISPAMPRLNCLPSSAAYPDTSSKT